MLFWQCQKCRPKAPRMVGSNPEKWVPHADIRCIGLEVEDVPITGSPELKRCYVCDEPGAELHHFAPSALFRNSGSWPTAYLCREHHREWHEKLTPQWTGHKPATD